MENKKVYPSVYPDPMRGAEQSYSNQEPYSLDTGMTLRDYFAGLAMEKVTLHKDIREPWRNIGLMDDFANNCYRVADAMMKAREET